MRTDCFADVGHYSPKPSHRHQEVNVETVTELLHAAGAGDEAAFDRLDERTYDELRRLARGGRAGETLSTTALVHEAYLKLAPGDNLPASDRAHFFRIAARAKPPGRSRGVHHPFSPPPLR